MKEFFAFVKKEFYHIFRDRRTIAMLIAMPMIMIVLFGFAISTEVKNARLVVLDPTKNVHTQAIVEKLDASEYFTLIKTIDRPEDIDLGFRRGDFDLAVVFSNDFAQNPKIQLVADASDPNTASISSSYANAIIQSYSMDSMPVVMTNVSSLYNPSMLSSYNFVPGVMGMILMLICAMMTSVSIVREKEMGTMEVLLVSPTHPMKMIMAKIFPYLVISIINLTIILLMSVFVLGVPIAGSLGWLMLFSILYIFVTLSLGLLVSTLVSSQIVAMLISGMVFMMPTVILSGMMFPIENMPLPLQWFSAILPPRWFISGVRKLMIQGVDIQYVWKEALILVVMAGCLILVSLKKFKVRL